MGTRLALFPCHLMGYLTEVAFVFPLLLVSVDFGTLFRDFETVLF